MEIKIRKIDKNTIVAIDDMARAVGKSRNAFLKEQIEMLARRPQIRQQEDKYEVLLKVMAMVIQENTNALKRLVD